MKVAFTAKDLLCREYMTSSSHARANEIKVSMGCGGCDRSWQLMLGQVDAAIVSGGSLSRSSLHTIIHMNPTLAANPACSHTFHASGWNQASKTIAEQHVFMRKILRRGAVWGERMRKGDELFAGCVTISGRGWISKDPPFLPRHQLS